MKIRYLIGVPIASIALLACGSSANEVREEERSNESQDVSIAECTSDVVGMVARLEITNNSSKRSNYSVDVAFQSPDGSTQYATGFAYVQSVEPGQQALSDAHSLTTAPGDFICTITKLDRTEDVG